MLIECIEKIRNKERERLIEQISQDLRKNRKVIQLFEKIV